MQDLFFLLIVTSLIRSAHCSMPKILGRLSNVTVPQGKDASFTCTVKNLGSYKVAWLKSDTKAILAIHNHMITNENRFSVMHNSEDTWTLTLKTVEPKDSGFYMCQVNSKPMLSQTAYLNVVLPPSIDDKGSTRDVSVLEGREATLVCKAEGNPIPTVTWRKESNKQKVYKGETIRMTNVTRDQMGAYMCIAVNGVPPARSKTINLSVNFKPDIKIHNQMVGAPLGTSISLECVIEAFPKPIIYWSHTECPLNSVNSPECQMLVSNFKYRINETELDSYKWKSTLIISSIEKVDFRNYICTAKNTIGDAQERITLFKIATPTRFFQTTTTTLRNYFFPDHERPKDLNEEESVKISTKNRLQQEEEQRQQKMKMRRRNGNNRNDESALYGENTDNSDYQKNEGYFSYSSADSSTVSLTLFLSFVTALRLSV